MSHLMDAMLKGRRWTCRCSDWFLLFWLMSRFKVCSLSHPFNSAFYCLSGSLNISHETVRLLPPVALAFPNGATGSVFFLSMRLSQSVVEASLTKDKLKTHSLRVQWHFKTKPSLVLISGRIYVLIGLKAKLSWESYWRHKKTSHNVLHATTF